MIEVTRVHLFQVIKVIKEFKGIRDRRVTKALLAHRDIKDLMVTKVDRVTKVLRDSREIRVLGVSKVYWVTRVQEGTKVTDLDILNFVDHRDSEVNRDLRVQEGTKVIEVSRVTEVSKAVLHLDL